MVDFLFFQIKFVYLIIFTFNRFPLFRNQRVQIIFIRMQIVFAFLLIFHFRLHIIKNLKIIFTFF